MKFEERAFRNGASTRLFPNREQAGWDLADKLISYAGHPELLVVALPRGGVPVAAPIAHRLCAPIDILVVRRICAPSEPELALGAIASGGTPVVNDEIVRAVGVSESELATLILREQDELKDRERKYLGKRCFPPVRGKIVILVDDGVATGSTMCAAISALRARSAGWIVAAAPIMASDSRRMLTCRSDDVVCVFSPADFQSVGQWYRDFPDVSDAEIRSLLAQTT